MNASRIRDKMLSAVNRLICLESIKVPALRARETRRIERLVHLEEKLVAKMVSLARFIPELPADEVKLVRERIGELHRIHLLNTNILCDYKRITELYFYRDLDKSLYTGEGKRSARPISLVEATA